MSRIENAVVYNRELHSRSTTKLERHAEITLSANFCCNMFSKFFVFFAPLSCILLSIIPSASKSTLLHWRLSDLPISLDKIGLDLFYSHPLFSEESCHEFPHFFWRRFVLHHIIWLVSLEWKQRLSFSLNGSVASNNAAINSWSGIILSIISDIACDNSLHVFISVDV